MRRCRAWVVECEVFREKELLLRRDAGQRLGGSTPLLLRNRDERRVVERENGRC